MRLAAALLALSTITTGAAAQDPLAGRWQGHWYRAGDSMAVTLHVQRDSTGRYAASFDSDRLRVGGIPFADVHARGRDVTLTLRGDRATTVFTGTVEGDSFAGTLREGADEGRFAYRRASNAGAELEEREITFASGAVTLAGTLILPRHGSGLPAVVFLHGSGAEGRWANRFLATQLARHGVAALIFDKRGVGRSTGDWRQASIEDLASDGAAAVTRLMQEPRVHAARVGIHGHSQGGTLAPLVAARSGRVAFVIGSAAAGVPPDSSEIFSVLNSVLPRATSAADSASARAYVGALVAAAYHGEPRGELDALAASLRDRPWFFAPPPADDAYWAFSRDLGRFRPLEWWARVRVPVLLVYGAEDQRVPAAESASRIAAALRGAGNRDVVVRIFPGADHTFRLPPGASGWPVTAPDYITTLLAWVMRR
jgi:dipeptidyl aminopeptidase/acylaminoacyl peptidase